MTFRPEAILVTATEAAALLEVTPRWIRQLVSEGYIEKNAQGRLTLAAVVRGDRRYAKDETRRSSKSASASRVQDARAEEIVLKIAERKGRLIDIVEHRDCMAEVIGTLKVGLDSVPAQVTTDGAIRGRIEKAIEAVLRRAAERFAAATADLAAGRAATDADGGDDTG